MITLFALVAFFSLTALKDFGIVFKYWDLCRGVAGVIVVFSLLIGNSTGL